MLLFLIIKHLSATALFAGLFQTLGVLCDLELVDALLDVTVHKDREVVHRPVDTVVGHTALRVVVSADFGGTVTGGDHRLALRADLIKIFLMLKVIETGTELLEGAVLVLELGALLLALHDQTGRKVGQTHG